MNKYVIDAKIMECDRIPRGCAQSRDPGLEDTHEEREGVFPYNCKVDARQEYGTVDDQTNNNRHHVHPQLPGHHLQIFNRDDLSTDQAGDAEGRVPTESAHNVSPSCKAYSLLDS